MDKYFVDNYGPVKGHGRMCFETDGAGFGVRLYQNGKKNRSFAVQYGLQVWPDLTYDEAARDLGFAMMHAAACDGKFDNERN